MIAAFVAAGLAASASKASALLNNRRDLNCTPFTGSCTPTGAHICDEPVQYNLTDLSCQTQYTRKP